MSLEMVQAVCGTDLTPCAEERVAASYKVVPLGTINMSLINKPYENGSDPAISLLCHEHNKTPLSKRFGKFPITTPSGITGSLKHDVEGASHRALRCRHRAGAALL